MSLSLVNHLGKKWSSFIEIMAMMAILSVSIAAMFSTVISGIYFAKDSENRIKAINLAREWLEWVTNLRNTNWLRFSSDQVNCWKIQDYDARCIGDIAFSTWWSIGSWGTTRLYVLENNNWAWYLTWVTSGSWLWVNKDWFYVLTWTTVVGPPCTIEVTTNCLSRFTREIQIREGASSWELSITSVVDWMEQMPQNVILKSTITNWKSKF